MNSNKKGVTSRLVIPFLFVAHKNEGRSYLPEKAGEAGKFLVSHKKMFLSLTEFYVQQC